MSELQNLPSLPDWYRLPTVEPGYRFLDKTELPTEDCQMWYGNQWETVPIRLYLHFPFLENSIKAGEGRYLFRVKI
jgi:hypothetical protein